MLSKIPSSLMRIVKPRKRFDFSFGHDAMSLTTPQLQTYMLDAINVLVVNLAPSLQNSESGFQIDYKLLLTFSFLSSGQLPCFMTTMGALKDPETLEVQYRMRNFHPHQGNGPYCQYEQLYPRKQEWKRK